MVLTNLSLNCLIVKHYTIALTMGVGSGEQGGRAPWIFIHGTDKVKGGLMVLFFGFVFSVGLSVETFSVDALGFE